MRPAPPLATISVGVLVERSKAVGQWAEFLWRATGILTGVPDTQPWTKLSDDGDRVRFYAGAAEVELYRTETGNYRDNLATGEPQLWVILRATESDPPYELFGVTADPAEGEAMTEAGNDLVEPVPMPAPIRDTISRFVAEHHVESQFTKRKRDRANPQALARRPAGDGSK